MQNHLNRLGVAIVVLAVFTLPLLASAPTGAIFTTLSDGSEVNLNLFPSKEAVYLDGGPGIGAPATAAGLDDGTYVFQVTDPPGKTLLSTDAAKCRQFTVVGGLITGVVAVGGCQHLTGTDIDHNAVTVQLFPFNDTPNPGGVYKVWVTKVADFLNGCAALGVSNGLDVVDCGFNAGNDHGFVPSDSKTDNFKVKAKAGPEIDSRFVDTTGTELDGRSVTWIDTLGASNIKWQYFIAIWNTHMAHVEAVEKGTHSILIANQTGCTVGRVWIDNVPTGQTGPQTVQVTINNVNRETSDLILVECVATQ